MRITWTSWRGSEPDEKATYIKEGFFVSGWGYGGGHDPGGGHHLSGYDSTSASAADGEQAGDGITCYAQSAVGVAVTPVAPAVTSSAPGKAKGRKDRIFDTISPMCET